ncbi:dienelactone hydrolase family protein [Paenibacillus sp. UNC451MF]|uniref:dienelactone hydrolase family protein n=1 Tax=Paenibacillus sp. UNC451MF TaxID=1449063 RepID=UPI00048AD591|nr:alpha/beta hydrolase family protein [Paenibacillus sp. UNC451MF]
MSHLDSFLNGIYDSLQNKRDDQLDAPWEQKRAYLIEHLIPALGEFELPEGEAADFRPVLLESVELDEVIRERIEITTLGGLRMPVYIVKPKNMQHGEQKPAVVLWHGHGYGSRSLVGLMEDGSPKLETGKLSDNIALELARRGLVVMAPEVAGFGDRRLQRDRIQDPELKNSCYNLSAALFMTGKTTAGLRVYEALRAAEYLSTLEYVDANRIGNMGHSGGGTIASLSAALDPRVKASVVGIYPNTYRGSILAVRHCLCNYIPGIMLHAEMPDLLGLIAPKPLFIEAGIDDPIFPVATTREAIQALEQIYGELGISTKFDSHIFEGKHEISGVRSFDWMMNTLHAL